MPVPFQKPIECSGLASRPAQSTSCLNPYHQPWIHFVGINVHLAGRRILSRVRLRRDGSDFLRRRRRSTGIRADEESFADIERVLRGHEILPELEAARSALGSTRIPEFYCRASPRLPFPTTEIGPRQTASWVILPFRDSSRWRYGTVILKTCPRPFGGGPKPTFET